MVRDTDGGATRYGLPIVASVVLVFLLAAVAIAGLGAAGAPALISSDNGSDATSTGAEATPEVAATETPTTTPEATTTPPGSDAESSDASSDESSPETAASDESSSDDRANETGESDSAGSEGVGDDPSDRSSSPADAVTFVDCETIEIHGAFDEVEVGSTMYASDGVDTEIRTYSDVTDETLEDVAWEGVGGYVIDEVTLLDDGDVSTVTNPEIESCLAEIRPERPTVEFVDAEATGDGEIEAIFAYDNPNDATLTPGAAFTAGTTDDYPPTAMEPGQQTFSVTWTPSSDDETLELTVRMDTFGLDDASAETPPAGEFLGSDDSDGSDANENETSENEDDVTDTTDNEDDVTDTTDNDTGDEGGSDEGNAGGEDSDDADSDESGTTDADESETTDDDSDSSGDTDPAEAVTFTDCDTVEIDGAFDEVEVMSTMYASDGVDTEIRTYNDVEDQTLENVAWEGVGGYVIDEVILVDDGEPLATVPNPELEACLEEIRPERPTVEFVDAEAIGDGEIEVTFAYDNPNDATLTPGASFTAGTTDDYPPTAMEPGEQTFSVTWTPSSDDETLELTVRMDTFGLDDVSAETPPAGEFTTVE